MTIAKQWLLSIVLTLTLASAVFAFQSDQIGLTASTEWSEVRVVSGDTVFVKLHIDSNTGVGGYDGICRSTGIASSSNLNAVFAFFYTTTVPTNGFETGSAVNQTILGTTTDFASQTISGYFLLGSVPVGANSFVVRANPYGYDDIAFDPLAPTTNTYSGPGGLARAGAGTLVTTTPGAPYSNSYMTVTTASTAPTLTDPGTFQSGYDNTTIKTLFTLPASRDAWSSPEAHTAKLRFYFGGTVHQEVRFNLTDVGSTIYDGILTWGGASFTVADDPSVSNTALTAIAGQTNTTALVDGRTYTVGIVYQETNKAFAQATMSFTYKTTALPITFAGPASSYRTSNSVNFDYTIPQQASPNTVKVRFYTAGTAPLGTALVRTWTMQSEGVGQHIGSVVITKATGAVTTLGGGSDSDLGTTVASDSVGIGGLTNGYYDIIVSYDGLAGNTSTSSAHTNVHLDFATSAPTITSPASGTSSNSFAMVYNQPETAGSGTKKVTFTRTGGAADGNSHVQIFAAGNLASGNGQTHTFAGSDLDGTGAVVTLEAGSTNALVDGAYYNVSLSYQDDLANDAALYTVTNWLYTENLNAVTVAGTGYNVNLNAIAVRKRLYRLTMNTNSGGANTLNSVTFAIGGTAQSSDFVSNGFTLWSSSNANATAFPGEATQIGSGVSHGATVTFNGLTAALTSTPTYFYLAVQTTPNCDATRTVTARVNSSSDITLASGTPGGTFPSALASALLPVELASLRASSFNGMVSLSWTTESEVNNAGFEVIRREVSESTYSTVASYRGMNADASLLSQAPGGNSAEQHNYTFVDNSVQAGVAYVYGLRTVSLDGEEIVEPMSVEVTVASLPSTAALHANFPNPFNSTTALRFELPQAAKVSLAIYDISGREVTRLVDGNVTQGVHTVTWNANQMASGTYIVQMTSGSFKSTRKIVLIK